VYPNGFPLLLLIQLLRLKEDPPEMSASPPVKKKIAIKIHTGQRCSVNGAVGTIRFIGETKFAPGKWFCPKLYVLS
jgi:hypothetical protein